MEQKRCVKCGKLLPADYKGKKCEHCKGSAVDIVKKGLAAVILFGGVILKAATDGKIDINKKV